MKRVFRNEDPDRGSLEVDVDSLGGVLLTCDRPGERAVSHALTPDEFEAMVNCVRGQIDDPPAAT